MGFKQPIALLGGTFDPVHNGHLYIASAVAKNFPLEHLYFLPCHQPVHRCHPEASPQDRLAMLDLAIKDCPLFSVDQRELKREGPSYMIDSLIALRQDYPTTPFYLIIGGDSYVNLSSWKEWQSLLDYAHLVVINRPEYEVSQQANLWLRRKETQQKDNLMAHLNGYVYHLTIPPCPISATLIRQAIKKQQSLVGLVPNSVAAYIEAHGLYISSPA